MIQDWSFQKQLSAGFGIMVGLAAISAGVAYYGIRTVIESKDRVLTGTAQNLVESQKLTTALYVQAVGFRGYLIVPNDKFLKEIEMGREQFLAGLNRLEAAVHTGEIARILPEIRKQHQLFDVQQERIIAMRRNGVTPDEIALAVTRDAQPVRDGITQNVNVLVTRLEGAVEESRRQAGEAASRALALVVGLSLASVVFAGFAALMLSRKLSRQIGSAVQHVQSSSSELQTTANQQASGAKEAVTAMSEITTTMSELLATSRQIAESAQQVAHIAQETAAAARGGDQTVSETQQAIQNIRRQVDVVVGHMLDLGKKSQQIGGILDIINELAEQTNILSINATIEAAGAGEQGKRFAVVGEEIRKLADRVSGSTKEIRALVEEIRAAVNTTVLATEGGSKAVDSGLQHFEEVTRGFNQIVGLVATTTQAAREIELSTKQQMTAVEQVNAAITGAAQATRETEASCSQTLETATQLAHLSHSLSRIVQAQAPALGAYAQRPI